MPHRLNYLPLAAMIALAAGCAATADAGKPADAAPQAKTENYWYLPAILMLYQPALSTNGAANLLRRQSKMAIYTGVVQPT